MASASDISTAGDMRAQSRDRFARVILDSMAQFVALIDANGNVVDVNKRALDAAGLTLADVEGRPCWTTFWWQVSDQVQETLRSHISRATAGETVRWDTPIFVGADRKRTIIIDASLTPVKDRNGKVVYIVGEGRDVTEKLAAERETRVAEAVELERSEDRFRLLVQGVIDYAIYMLDPNGVITSWNAGGERIKGYAADEVIGQHFSRFFTEGDRIAGLPAKALQTALREGKYEAEGWRVRKDGTRFWASVVLDAIRDRNGRHIGFAKVTRDHTERREAALALEAAQQQLLQAQKMEGIGHLTGGVAHDFNNLLTIIIGNLETLQRVTQDSPGDTARMTRLVGNAMRGAERAAALTQRLLAFSRQQPLQPRPLDVNTLVGGMSDLLRRSLGEQIAIETVLAGGLWQVNADQNQLEVAILNLAVNARDAMPDGGRLTIETRNEHLDRGYMAGEAEAISGDYVTVSVTDTGSGMSPEIIERAFEPFFTTKDVGAGTGLGLSQVYGFVKQSGGHVKIHSQVGKGTTVRLHLPRLLASTADEVQTGRQQQPPRSTGAETILVVEDDVGVRSHTLESLRDLGYRTLDAGDARSALRVLRDNPDIQLLFSDVVLPAGLNGQQLADEARRLRPDLKVLMTSGYARNAILRDGKVDPGVQLISKPFSFAALAAKVRSVFDMPTRSGRILLVEDEILIQMLAVDQLESLGFKVETAASATEAMSKIRLNGDLDAAIVDLGLPDRKGDVLIGEMRAVHPQMPIVVASGYGEAEAQKRFGKGERMAFVAKPYAADQLKAALSRVNVEI